MFCLKKTLALLCLSASAAHAEQTLTNLQGSAQVILDQLQMSQQLTAGVTYYAGTGGIVDSGVMQTATITDAMRDQYNADIQAVIDANYYTAEQLFLDRHNSAMASLDVAVDQLVSATAVLMEVQAIASMAAAADTVPEQMALQAVLTNNDMTISSADTAAYNSALGAVQSYAREAGAFLAAARSEYVTSQVDSYASNSAANLYTATVVYAPTADILNVTAENTFGIGFQGFFGGNIVTLEQVYAAGYGS